MKAYYSLLNIALTNKKIDIIDSKISSNIEKSAYKKIYDHITKLINDADFIIINGKYEKLTFLCVNEIYYLIRIIKNNNAYSVRIMHFNEKELNPFNPFIKSYFIEGNDNKESIITDNIDSLLTQDIINHYLSSNHEIIIATLIQALLLHDKPILIYDDPNVVFFWISLIGLLIPNNRLFDYSYTFGQTLKDMRKFDIFLISKERMITTDEIYYFDFKNIKYPNLKLNKYPKLISSLLLNSINDVKFFKEAIEELIINNNIDEERAINLNNLISAKIEAFTNTSELKQAIIDSKLKYNNNLIASKIYTALDKFILNNDILYIYKYVYDYIESSHDDIIKLFFDNLDKFGINKNNNPRDYLNLIINNSPFDLKDYYDYLVRYNLFDDLYNEAFNTPDWIILLESILRDVKYHNKSLVPNKYLEYYIKDCINNKRIENLDLIIDRISTLTPKAASRLLYLSFIDIFKANEFFILDYGTYYSFRLFERMEPKDSTRFYEKTYDFVSNKKEYINIYLEREEKKPEYYKELNSYLEKDNYNIFLDYKEIIEIDNHKNIDFDYLDYIYDSYYLNSKKNRDNTVFIDKIFEYLNSFKNKDKIDEAIKIYNRYFKKLDDNYKDKTTAIRRLINIIYSNPDIIFENDLKYYEILFEIDEFLQKKKEKSPIYLDILLEGLNVKKASIDKVYRAKFFKDRFIIKNKYFGEDNQYFNHYYLQFLILTYFDFIPLNDLKESYIFINWFNLLFDNLKDYKWFKYVFINTILNVKEENYKLFLMYYLLFSTNTKENIYIEIRDKIISEVNKPKKILKEYYHVIDNVGFIKGLEDNFKKYVDEYIINNSNFIMRFIWKRFKK